MTDWTVWTIADEGQLIQEAAEWFSSKWDIPAAAYRESMGEALSAEGTGIPQWFIVREGDKPEAPIIAGCGIIENDFHDRPDLTPNLCALYVEERYRGRGIAKELLDRARIGAGGAGFDLLYLVTELEGFYERCGWEYLFDVSETGGNPIRMYRASTLAPRKQNLIPDAASSPIGIREVDAKDNPDLLRSLVALWRSSVEATHGFLSADDIERIGSYVPQAIESVQHLAIAEGARGELQGFIGINGTTVEMLFLHPTAQGKGIGSRLMEYSMDAYGANKLDVNEQNEQARGFYEHIGFETIGRSETDDMGDPFPILHMQLRA